MSADSGYSAKHSTRRAKQEKRRVGKFQIGEEIGRGGSGTVFQALNLESGDFVAMKEVSLSKMAEEDYRTIQREVTLLKKLTHANIVEYIDTIKTEQCLHIILEYCENGSLRHVLKRFGNLSESLVALYVAQVLEGLVYLHNQGVLHRDIKAANILTTKEGTIKLADFGVATEVRRGSQTFDGEVVGTPFWMAPEVIEMSPPSTACDMWSLGCTVVELLTGKPPYFDLSPMAALFRIVQDAHPPLPEGISDSLHDFLLQTFHKEPLLRPTAEAMLEHPWIVNSKRRAERRARTATSSEHVGRHGSRSSSRAAVSARSRTRSRGVSSASHSGDSLSSGGSGMSFGKGTAADVGVGRGHMGVGAIAVQTRSRGASAAGAYRPGFSSAVLGQGLARTRSTATMPRAAAPQDPTSIGGTASAAGSTTGITAAEAEHGASSGTGATVQIGRGGVVAAASRRTDGSIDATLSPRIAIELSGATESVPASADANGDTGESNGGSNAAAEASGDNGDSGRGTFRGRVRVDRALSAATAERAVLMAANAQMEIRRQIDLKLVECAEPLEEADFGSAFDWAAFDNREHAEGEGGDADTAALSSWLQQRMAQTSASASSARHRILSKSSNDLLSTDSWGLGTAGRKHASIDTNASSWDNDIDMDDLEEGEYFAQQITIAADQIERLSSDGDDSAIVDACEQLLRLFEETPGMVQQFIVQDGIIPTVIDLLDADNNEASVLYAVLQLLNRLVRAPAEADVEQQQVFTAFQERLCLVGLFPTVFAFASREGRFSTAIRLETAKFVTHICMASTLTHQIFISCGGLLALVSILDVGADEGQIDALQDESLALINIAIDGFISVFNQQSIAISKDEFCHLLVNYGLLRRLAAVFLCFCPSVAAQRHPQVPTRLQQIGDIFVLFSCGDDACKEQMCEPTVLRSIMHALNPEEGAQRLDDDAYALLAVKLLRCIANLSTAAGTLDSLEEAGAIPTLVPFVQQHGATHSKAWQHHAIHALFYLCRINKRRQEQAVSVNLVAPLMRIVTKRSPLRQFVLPVLCDLAHASTKTRAQLWAHSGVAMFLDLLEEDYWGAEAFSSLHVWLVNDRSNVEGILLRPASLQKVVALFLAAQQADFERLLDPLIDVLNKSPAINQALGRSALFVADVVLRLQSSGASALVRKNLLRVLQVLVENHPVPGRLVIEAGICPVVQSLTEDESMVLVSELAAQLLQRCIAAIEEVLVTSVEDSDDEAGDGGANDKKGAEGAANSNE